MKIRRVKDLKRLANISLFYYLITLYFIYLTALSTSIKAQTARISLIILSIYDISRDYQKAI